MFCFDLTLMKRILISCVTISVLPCCECHANVMLCPEIGSGHRCPIGVETDGCGCVCVDLT